MDSSVFRSVNLPYPQRLYGKDHYELGLRTAALSGGMFKPFITMLAAWARRNHMEYRRLVAEIPRRRKILSAVYPDGLRELEGMARGSGIALDDMLAARALSDSIHMPRCTTFGAVPPSTRGGKTILAWNLDAPFSLKMFFGNYPLFVREVKGTIPYLCVGRPWFWNMGILNAEGLGCVVNGVGTRDEGDGLTPFELNARAMETCTDVAGAARVFQEGPRQATRAMSANMLLNWNTTWSDRHGNLSLFEYSHNHFHRQPAGEDGIMASANHHQFLGRERSGSFDPLEQEMIAGSYSRLARAWALLHMYRGKIDPQVAGMIACDHIPDYSLLERYGIGGEWWEEKVDDSTICAHAWNMKKHLMRGELSKAFMERQWSCTMYSLLVQPRDYVVWFTNGHPCRSYMRPIYWGEMLGAEAPHPPDILSPRELFKPGIENARRGMFMRDTRRIDKWRTRQWLFVTGLIERGAFRELDDD
ncbi:MAG: hypothetical protein C4536_11510 [Actinobacteria bacterium]|jgi:hypothetical protein|nr:MAG: hypothetical protein C4536_11510 [Actinomycetota bacterium]